MRVRIGYTPANMPRLIRVVSVLKQSAAAAKNIWPTNDAAWSISARFDRVTMSDRRAAAC
eukprot:scaffold180_cov134-Isochrysis_galbana.AAC.13